MVFALCYSADWLPYVRIAVHAIQCTNPGATIHLLSDVAGHMKIPGCRFHDVEELFQQRCGNDHSINTRFTKYAHYRLLLPEVVAEPRVLYVDSDALVDADLSEFWGSGLAGGALLAGVTDLGIDPRHNVDIGLAPDDPYINAGVTLMDLDSIRQAGLYERWLERINARPYICGDQDVLNLTCCGRIALVGNEYNSSESTGWAEAPKVAHWAGPHFDKPWINRNIKRHDIWQRWADSYASAAPATPR